MISARSLIILLLLVYVEEGQSSAKFRLCGNMLIQAMAIVCKNGGYNVTFRSHRAKRGAGIVDECCWNMCTVKTLESYCNQPADLESKSRIFQLLTRRGWQRGAPIDIQVGLPGRHLDSLSAWRRRADRGRSSTDDT